MECRENPYSPNSSIMTEIQSSEQLNELEILQKTQPAWKFANTEPFARSAADDVVPPNWDKSGFLDTNGNLQGQGGTGGAQATLRAVMGVQQTDGSFAIKIVSFAGNAFDP